MTHEELIASAKGCGLEAKITGSQVYAQRDGGDWFRWNPRENAEQRWVCLKELLRRGFRVEYAPDNVGHYIEQLKERWDMALDCPAEEFAAKALAKVVSADNA